jgi:hypothetical protein
MGGIEIMIKNKEQISKIIIITTLMITVGLNFFATPYVFSGELMKPIWRMISHVFLGLLLLELAILNIHPYSLKERVLIWSFIAIALFEIIFSSTRITTNLLIINITISIYILIKQNKDDLSTLNRLSLFVFAAGILVFSVIGKIQLFNKNAFLVSGLLLGFVIGILLFMVSMVIYSKQNNNKVFKFELLLATIFMAPISFFLLLNIMNYSLDFSEPTSHAYTITNLEVKSGFRNATAYKVYFEIDGTTYNIGVTQSEFYAYQIEDLIEIQTYKGFLKQPYMIRE